MQKCSRKFEFGHEKRGVGFMSFIFFILKTTSMYSGPYLGFKCNFCFFFFANALFWASGNNLGLKHPANSCNRFSYAAGVQVKPKCCRALEVAKWP